MPFCSNCGKQITDDVQTCPFCGRPVNFQGAQQTQQANQQNFQQAQQNPNFNNANQANQQNFQQNAGQFNQQANGQTSFNAADPFNADDMTSQFDPNDIAKNKAYALLAYLGPFFLVPLLAAKNSPFARFHTNQGIVLFVCSSVINIILGIASRIRFIGYIFSYLNVLTAILLTVVTLMGIVYTAQGKAKELPVIGKIKILK